MAKLSLRDLTSGFSRSSLNQNFQDIVDTLQDKVLFRDNDTGEANQMQNALDMNSNRILNTPSPTYPLDLVRLTDLEAVITGSSGLQFNSLVKDTISIASGEITADANIELDPSLGNTTVYLNGILQADAVVDNSGSPSTVTLSSAVESDSEIVVYRFGINDIGTAAASNVSDSTRNQSAQATLDERLNGLSMYADLATAVAASTGKRLLIDESVTISSAVALTEGICIEFVEGNSITVTTVDTGAFTATDLEYFCIKGIGSVIGESTSLGATNHAAVSVVSCTDFDIGDGVEFNTWMGSGVTCVGTALRPTGGRVQKSKFVKGDVSGTTTGYGVQDNAPVQVYEYCRGVVVDDNDITGEWYCTTLVQSRVSTGAARIRDTKITKNRSNGTSNYGIVCYSVGGTVGAIADNGSGLFRVTVTDHELTDGDLVTLEGCGDANGIWTVTVFDDDKFDLDNSTYSGSTSNGVFRMSLDCESFISGNSIKNVLGNREFTPGVNPYGMGLYLQAVGGIVALGNELEDCCQETNSETLTPGGIGVNGATGPIYIAGGHVKRSGYNGIDASNSSSGSIIIEGVHVIDSDNREIHADGCDNLDLNVIVYPQRSSGSNDVVYAQDSENINITAKIKGLENKSRAISLLNCTNFSLRDCDAINLSPASVTCELVYIDGCDGGDVRGNNFNGNASAFTALTVEDTTDTIIEGNRIKMTADGAARSTVRMFGTCTDTIFEKSNKDFGGRMENSSTGGSMHTRASSNASGGKTRQQGDTIQMTAPVTTGTAHWFKLTASAGALNWESTTLS